MMTPELPFPTRSKTSNALQLDWKIESEFPCCPQEYNEEPLKAYADRLEPGALFCQNHKYASEVVKRAMSENRASLYVLSKFVKGSGIKGWAVAKITYENDLFVHINLHNYFTELGAEKEYCLAQGLEWTGGDSIDDYCS